MEWRLWAPSAERRGAAPTPYAAPEMAAPGGKARKHGRDGKGPSGGSPPRAAARRRNWGRAGERAAATAAAPSRARRRVDVKARCPVDVDEERRVLVDRQSAGCRGVRRKLARRAERP